MNWHYIRNTVVKLLILLILIISINHKAKAADYSVQIEVEKNNLPAFYQMKVHFPDPATEWEIPVKPLVSQDTAAGWIEITFNPVDIEQRSQQMFNKGDEEYPLLITTLFPAPKTVQIMVKTKPFDHLTSHYSYVSQQYYFDIHFPETTALAVQDEDKVPSSPMISTTKPQSETAPTPPEEVQNVTAEKKDQDSRPNWANTLFRAIKTAFVIVVILFLLAGAALLVIYIYSGRNVLKPHLENLKKTARETKDQSSDLKKEKPSQSTIERRSGQKKKVDNIEVSDNKEDKKRTAIQKLMKKKGLTYEEAALYYNVNKGKFNAE